MGIGFDLLPIINVNMNTHPKTSDEVTLRQLLIQSLEYFRYFLRYWYVIALVSVVVAAFSYYQKKDIKETYNARVVALFRMNASAKNNAAIVQIFSKVAQSRLVIEKTLFDRANINGKDDYFINHYLNIYRKVYPNFIDYELPQGFSFEHDDISTFDLVHAQTLNLIVKKIMTPEADFSDGFVHASMEEKIGLMTANFSSPSQELSAFFVVDLMENLEAVYHETVVSPKQAGVNMLSQQIDSLKTKIKTQLTDIINYEKAKKQSSSRSKKTLLSKEIKTTELELDITKHQVKALQEGYAMASKELGQETPVITVTERPVLPLEPYLPSRKWFIIKGFITGVIIAVFLMLMFKVISDTLKE